MNTVAYVPLPFCATITFGGDLIEDRHNLARGRPSRSGLHESMRGNHPAIDWLLDNSKHQVWLGGMITSVSENRKLVDGVERFDCWEAKAETTTVHFESADEATLFKLTWGGK